MSSNVQAIILALIQGLTEFLPVSSSAHLILLPKLLKWQDQGLAFDVAIHVGTLCAVIWYFRHELKLMLVDWSKSIFSQKTNKNARLTWAIGFGTIPVGLSGLLLHNYIASQMRATWIIAVTTIAFGILLGITSVIAKQTRSEYSVTWRDVLIIGCAQALSLIPGTSRSGITLTAGLFVGLTRTAAARYSFLLSIPVILLAGGLECYKLYTAETVIAYQPLLLGFVTAAISGYLCISLFLRLLDKYGVMPFVIYRIILGILLLYVFGINSSM